MFQIKESQWINLDAIVSVKVFETPQTETIEQPYGINETKKIGETLTIRLRLTSGDDITVEQSFSHSLHERLFPALSGGE